LQISAVLLARTIALFDSADLNPRGTVFGPSLIPILNERFSFQKFPSKGEDYDPANGVSFENGYFGDRSISTLAFYGDGIKIDLQSSTEDGQSLILETLQWLSRNVGITFSEKMPIRWRFLSQVLFFSDTDLNVLHPALGILGDKVSAEVSTRTGIDLHFKTNSVALNFDRSNGEIPIANFTIERRLKSPFSENRYFSGAPLQTELHIKLLQEFEENVRKYNEGR
jgi:hypothetical protein